MKKFFYGRELVSVKIERYGNGRKAICLYDVDDMPFSTATINVSEKEVDIEKVIVKDYSENEGMYKFLRTNNIVAPSEEGYSLAFGDAPVCELLPESEWEQAPEPDWDIYDFND